MTTTQEADALGIETPQTLFIDDRFETAASGATFETIDPSTESVLAIAARGEAADVDRAVAAARRATRGPWREMTPAERGRMIFRLAEVILAHKEEIARVETLDVGKPLRESRGDVDGVVATLRYNGGAADKLEGATIPLGRDVIDFTLLQPAGVTAHIVPWNYPLGMLARSVAPALAAGCTAVIKPAEQSPLSALWFARCCREAGIPPGVVNVVTGFGEEAGAALVAHPDVRGITFTGSVETGRVVYATAARGLKPAVLELGGKNPVIIFPDADLDRAVTDLLDGAFGNSGQVCSSSSRLILHRSIHDAFLDRLAAAASRLTVGPGLDDRDLGPVVSAEQYERVTGYIAAGARNGGRVRHGGGRPSGLGRGYFIEPTIIDRVDPAHVTAREEIFGPVAVALTFDTVAEATALANGLGYGLVAGVYTADIGTALTLARDIEAGSVWINGWFIGGQQAPTGGIKDSGVGRERGLPGIMNYLEIKNVGIRL
ncbi:aldehyde dehydrogenase family protein [Ancylobacter terrae]|uniref:aldehyde dehydrogenase family protein n=1 Tax=Ancylobacter sp. sgz301288 TaxID=3342077 RepID=UPI00385A70AC